jgi:hypothetical protein
MLLPIQMIRPGIVIGGDPWFLGETFQNTYWNWVEDHLKS